VADGGVSFRNGLTADQLIQRLDTVAGGYDPACQGFSCGSNAGAEGAALQSCRTFLGHFVRILLPAPEDAKMRARTGNKRDGIGEKSVRTAACLSLTNAAWHSRLERLQEIMETCRLCGREGLVMRARQRTPGIAYFQKFGICHRSELSVS
jgi:hypothetical protein